MNQGLRVPEGFEPGDTKIRQENNRSTSFTIMLKKHQNSWQLGFRPRLHWGAYNALQSHPFSALRASRFGPSHWGPLTYCWIRSFRALLRRCACELCVMKCDCRSIKQLRWDVWSLVGDEGEQLWTGLSLALAHRTVTSRSLSAVTSSSYEVWCDGSDRLLIRKRKCRTCARVRNFRGYPVYFLYVGQYTCISSKNRPTNEQPQMSDLLRRRPTCITLYENSRVSISLHLCWTLSGKYGVPEERKGYVGGAVSQTSCTLCKSFRILHFLRCLRYVVWRPTVYAHYAHSQEAGKLPVFVCNQVRQFVVFGASAVCCVVVLNQRSEAALHRAFNKKLSYCCDSRSYCMQYFNAIRCDCNISTSE